MWRCWSAGLLLLLLVLLLVGATSSQAVPGMEGCDAEVPCQELEANGLTFQCRVAGPEDGTPVVLLHGCVPLACLLPPCAALRAATRRYESTRVQRRIPGRPASPRRGDWSGCMSSCQRLPR